MRPTMRDIVLLPHVAWLEQTLGRSRARHAEQDVAASARNGMRRRFDERFGGPEHRPGVVAYFTRPTSLQG